MVYYCHALWLDKCPTVFQWLMHEILSILNPIGSPSFVSVYIDNLLASLEL